MPTTALAQTTNPDPLRYSTTGTAATLTAADVANGNHIASAKNILVLAHNTDGAATHSVTITSAADANLGRTGSVTAQALAIDEVRYFFLTADGWTDTNDQYLISSDHANVKIGWFLA